MDDEWLNECRIEDIHAHNIDTDILIKLHEFPIFRLSDVNYSPHEPHKEEGLNTYHKGDVVLAKFISHDEVRRSGNKFGNVAFSPGTPNIEVMNCNGKVVDVLHDAEAGGNTVVVDVGSRSEPVYVFAIDRNFKKVSVGDFVSFHKIHQIVVKKIISGHKVMQSAHSHDEFFYRFKCSNCGLQGETKKNKSKESLYHRVFYNKNSRQVSKEQSEAGIRNVVPIYANHVVCPSCSTKGLVWKLEKVSWRR